MEYLVLARKWRPQRFEDVVGQDHVVKTLRNAIRQGRVAHAIILSGPRGVGKTSVARIMAKAMNCVEGPTETPCNRCTICREITEGISVDVREIDGASHRGIDEIRNLRENIKFAPFSSRYKVYIIDEVHMLTREAFNALLKTLEEPPSHVFFIFATTESHKIPPTILSRCQCYEFRRIPLKLIREVLEKIAAKEGVRISGTGINWIARAGEGSLRDAQGVFDQIVSYAGFDVDDGSIKELLGCMDRQFLHRMSEAVLEKNAGVCLRIMEEVYYAGLDMHYFYQMLLNHFRDLLLVKLIGTEKNVLEVGEEEQELMRVQVGGVSRETLHRFLDILIAEEESVRRSQNPRVVIEAILVRMACIEPLVPLDTILSKMEGIEKRLMSGRSSLSCEKRYEVNNRREEVRSTELFDSLDTGVTREAERVQERSLSFSSSRWEDFVAFVRKRSSPLWSKIQQGKFLGCENKRIRIGFSKDFIFLDDIREKTQSDVLTSLAREYFADDVTVRIETLEEDEYSRDSNDTHVHGDPTSRKNNNARQEVLNHPLLQKVLDVFEGAVVREVLTRPRKDGIMIRQTEGESSDELHHS